MDIGSNTTRLLVADVLGALPREVLARKVHTHLGRALRGGEEPDAVAARIAAGVAEQLAAARSAGAERIRVVATAAVRDAAGGDALCAAVRAVAGVPVEVLPEDEEARLAFRGATATAPAPPPEGSKGARRALERHAGAFRSVAEDARVAVVDVGGGSTELAIGHPDGTVHRCASVPTGSGLLADAHLRTDPPGPEQLAAVRWAASDAADALLSRCGAAATVDRALAVGGSAASLSRIAGPRLDGTSVAVAVATLTAAPAAEVAERTGLLPDRIRLLPAGLLLLAAVADRLGRPLELGCGGLREGVCLELATDNQ